MENEKLEEILLVLDEKLDKAVGVLKDDYAAIRAGRANPHVLDKVLVDAYGAMTPINQVGNIAVSDARCLVISPWDKSLLKNIEKAIQASNVGINPSNDGTVIRLVFPELTEERRRDLVKQVRKMGEETKVAARNIRREAMEGIKKLKTGKEISEDEASNAEQDVEKAVSKCVENIDKTVSAKEKELLTV